MQFKVSLNDLDCEILRAKTVLATSHWAVWELKGSTLIGKGVERMGELTFLGGVRILTPNGFDHGLSLAIERSDCVRNQLPRAIHRGAGEFDHYAVDTIAQFACFGLVIFP